MLSLCVGDRDALAGPNFHAHRNGHGSVYEEQGKIQPRVRTFFSEVVASAKREMVLATRGL